MLSRRTWTQKSIFSTIPYKVLKQAKLTCGEKSEEQGRKSEGGGEKGLARDMRELPRIMEQYSTSHAKLCKTMQLRLVHFSTHKFYLKN